MKAEFDMLLNAVKQQQKILRLLIKSLVARGVQTANKMAGEERHCLLCGAVALTPPDQWHHEPLVHYSDCLIPLAKREPLCSFLYPEEADGSF